MNIYQKLIEVRKAIPFLKKDKEGYQFKFVSSSQTLGALREAMDANNLLLIPRVMSERVLGHETKKGDHQYFTVLGMEFTWVNAEVPEETIVCSWTGQGLDDGEKGVGKALTYAEKYFMLKFFNVPTDKDDPDDHQKPTVSVQGTPKSAPKQEPPSPVQPSPEKATKAQLQAIHAQFTKREITDRDMILFYIGWRIGRVVTSSKELTEKEANQVIDTLIAEGQTP